MNDLREKSVTSELGITYYWTNEIQSNLTIIFLPGLTADHRLFESQLAFFQNDYKVLVWDCPCHGLSRPYGEFTYSNVSNELNHILENEHVDRAVFVGQTVKNFYGEDVRGDGDCTKPHANNVICLYERVGEAYGIPSCYYSGRGT